MVSGLYKGREVSEEEYVIDHVERLTERNDSWQKYPATDDTRTIHLEQLLDLKLERDWDLAQNERSMKYVLKNVNEIQKHFKMALNNIQKICQVTFLKAFSIYLFV